ncbi:MAG: hypothetical protein K2L45_03130, partial [Muribaculaceae bacterium]|nr:hypothetical protein [Muribaculaceae bacterium]
SLFSLSLLPTIPWRVFTASAPTFSLTKVGRPSQWCTLRVLHPKVFSTELRKNLFIKIRGFPLKITLTLHPETNPSRLPTLVAITSMASKYTDFQANKSPYSIVNR